MDFKDFYNVLEDYLESFSIDRELKNILVNFTSSRKWTMVNSKSAEAPALIKPQSNYIAFNPVLIAASLFELRKALNLVDDKDEFLTNAYKSFYPLCKSIKMFLLLHEIGHWLYTADPSAIIPFVERYCSNFPVELSMYLYNVVEDSIIQRLFMIEYRSSVYRQAFDIGICCFQGAEAVKTYVSKSESQNWSIKTKLFYFIIRAYNLHNSEVQNMFNIPDKIGWKEDTIQAFDQAITTVDKLARAEYVFKVLAPLVFRDLVEEIDASDGTEATAEDSLLDQDKLYTSKNPPAKGNSKGSSPSSNSEESEDEDTNKSEDEESEDISEETTDSDNSSDGNSTQEDTEDDGDEGQGTSNSDESQDSSEDSEEDSEEDSSSSKSGDDEGEEESFESTDNSNSSEDDGEPEQCDVTPTDPGKTIIEQIKEACEELNKSINGANEPSEEKSVPELKPQTNPLATSCNVIDHTVSSSNNDNEDEDNSKKKSKKKSKDKSKDNSNPLTDTATMNNVTLSIYNNALNVLDKIFTMSNSTLHGLDQGELDEDELYTYFTEKNLNIYKEEYKVKQDKKVVVYFVLDNSGSMGGRRFDYASAAFVGLIHALEDIQIKCCLLTFGEHVRLLKRFDESSNFLGVESNLQHRVNIFASNLEDDTILFPALDYILNDETFLSQDPDLCKVVIVATDGCTNNMSECAYLAEKIAEDALVFSIGLDMSSRLEYLQAVMPGAIVRNYEGSNIATQLPEDIYEEIINRFLLY